MPRLYDADKVEKEWKEQLTATYQDDYGKGFQAGLIVAVRQPTVEAEPVRHGHWIETIGNGKMKRVTSCCGDDQTRLTTWYKPNFCPNCGAKMDGSFSTFTTRR